MSPVFNWECQLMWINLYNSHKMFVCISYTLQDCDIWSDTYSVSCRKVVLHSSWIKLIMYFMHFRCLDVTETCHRFLDLTGPFQLGGLSLGHDSTAKHRAVRTSGFVGCIRDLHIDERLIDLASYVWNNGTSEGCAARTKFCQSSPCQNSGLTVLHVN